MRRGAKYNINIVKRNNKKKARSKRNSKLQRNGGIMQVQANRITHIAGCVSAEQCTMTISRCGLGLTYVIIIPMDDPKISPRLSAESLKVIKGDRIEISGSVLPTLPTLSQPFNEGTA